MSKFTIQDIFITYGDEYKKNHNLSNEQWKVFNAIRNCGTKNLGYHISTCDECGERYLGYNSCRNRHCPMCQNYAREKWIQKESSYLLDTKYFHIITTVPYELNEIFMNNEKRYIKTRLLLIPCERLEFRMKMIMWERKHWIMHWGWQ